MHAIMAAGGVHLEGLHAMSSYRNKPVASMCCLPCHQHTHTPAHLMHLVLVVLLLHTTAAGAALLPSAAGSTAVALPSPPLLQLLLPLLCRRRRPPSKRPCRGAAAAAAGCTAAYCCARAGAGVLLCRRSTWRHIGSSPGACTAAHRQQQKPKGCSVLLAKPTSTPLQTNTFS